MKLHVLATLLRPKVIFLRYISFYRKHLDIIEYKRVFHSATLRYTLKLLYYKCVFSVKNDGKQKHILIKRNLIKCFG